MQKILVALVVILMAYPVFGQSTETEEEAVYPVFDQSTEKTENKENKEKEEKDPVADKRFTIQTNPFLPFSGIFEGANEILFAMDLESQFKLSGRSNIGVELSFLYYHEDVEGDYDYNANSQPRYEKGYRQQYFQINIRPIYIFRPFNTGIKGFYLGFYPHFGLLRTQKKNEAALYGEVGFGLDVGYKWVFRDGFTLQLGNGLGKTYGIPERPGECSSFNSDGRITFGNTTDIRILDFKLGYSW